MNPLSGNLVWVQTDLVLPGNAGMDVRVQRVYNSHLYLDYPASTEFEEDSWVGLGWKLHFGRVVGGRVSESGMTYIEMRDGSRHPLYTTSAYPEGWVTRSFWRYDRNQHTLKLGDGRVYTFGREVYLNDQLGYVRYVTEIRDIYNNRIEFEYFPDPGPKDGISRIRQFVGAQMREVTFDYSPDDNQLVAMHYGGRTWTYRHEPLATPGFTQLRFAEGPGDLNGSKSGWEFGYHSAGEISMAIGPHGGSWHYTYADVAQKVGAVTNTIRVIASKTTKDRNGNPVGQWLYSYGIGANSDETLIGGPEWNERYRFFGIGTAGPFEQWRAGLLAERTVEQGSQVLARETLTWLRSEAVSPDYVAGSAGLWADDDVYNALPAQRTITRGIQSWTTTFEYRAGNYNDHGLPWRITEDGEFTRTTSRTFTTGFVPHITTRIASEEVRIGLDAATSSWIYDLNTGFVTSATTSAFTTTFEATPEGNVAARTDPRGNRTTFAYDWGAVREIRTPLTTRTFEINPDGSVAAEVIGGLRTDYGYDPEGRPTYVKGPGSNAPLEYDYGDQFGRRLERLIHRSIGLGEAQTAAEFHMDGFGRARFVNDVNAGLWTHTAYDVLGRVFETSAPYADTAAYRYTTTSYDALNRITQATTQPDGSVTTFTYAGNDVIVSDAEGRTTRYDYDSAGSPDGGRLVRVTDPLGQQTLYTYDVRGNLLTVSGPGTTPTRMWTYNSRGLLVEERHPESGVTTYNEYDANGNLLRVTDAAGAVTTFTYDADNRLTRRDAPGTDDDVTLTYDAAGRVATMSTAGASTSFAYDTSGRTSTRTDVVNGQVFQSSYTYDGHGKLKAVQYPSGRTVGYGYDAAGRLTQVTNNGQLFAHSFTYDIGGRLASYVTGAVTHTITYDSRDRAQRLQAQGPAGGLDLTYAFDRTSQVTGITDPRPGMSQTFGYDALGRLTAASGPWNQLSWTYDAAGNRLTETRSGAATNYQYDSATQRLQSTSGAATQSFTYDPVGRLTSDSQGTYTYNASGLLKTFSGGGTSASYGYDSAGLRISRSINGVTTYSARGLTSQTLSELEDACGVKRWTRDYIYAGSRLLGAVKFTRPPATVAFTTASSSAAEGASSTSVQVRLTTPDGAPLPCALSVSYTTASGTATQGADFIEASGTLTFAAGSASGSTQAISVTITGDTADESDETLTVTLSNVQGGSLGPVAIHTLTITDDDDPVANQPPSVALTAPANGSSYAAPATISLTASASDADGTISRVDFYANGTLLNSDTSSPFAYMWAGVAGGSYFISAVAIDNGGASTTSAAATITVSSSGGSSVLLADDFNDDLLDATKWDTSSLFSGTKDTAVPVAEMGSRLAIGPLLDSTAGSHYNGIDSAVAYDFTGAAAHVELLQAASTSATAYAMFTVGINSANNYRLYITGTTLIAQRQLAGVKHNVTFAYDPVAHRYLRIRHDAATGEVVWETAPSAGGVPGSWTVRRQEAWDTASVPLTAVSLELKAGTSDAQTAPGTVIFDNFKAARAGTGAETVIYAADVAAPQGAWRHVEDPSAAAGIKLATADQGLATSTPLASPASYFDVPFMADTGVRYRIWLRLRGVNNSPANDSVWVQFSGSLNQVGQPAYRIGTTDALAINLENCDGCGISGWGWQTSAYETTTTGEVWFAASGTHTLRVQVREDGVEFDQIVISAIDYVDLAPGPAIADATIVPRPAGNQPSSASLTAPSHGATFTAPASITLTATASDAGGSVARVDFYANGALLGTDSIAPYAFTWSGGSAGSYSLTAVAVDDGGATTSTASRTVTIFAAPSSETVLLAYDFNDNSLDTAKWDTTSLFSGTKDSTVAMAETGGQIRIGPLLANTSGSHYNGIDSQQTYDVTGASASVELVQPASGGAFTMFTLGTGSTSYYRWYVTGTTLLAQRNLGGTKHNVSVPYDATSHRYLRIRHDPTTGDVVWETAPSVGGAPGTWTVRRQEAWDTTAVPLEAVQVELKAGTSDAQAAPGTAIFDNFKVSIGGSDETVLLWDDFSGTSLNTATWAATVQSGGYDAAVPVSQTTSRVAIGPLLTNTSGSHYNGILSQTAFDLTGAKVSVEAVTAPSADTAANMMLTLTVDLQHHYRVYVESGFLRFERKTAASGKQGLGAVLAFDPAAHAFWRIRHNTTTDEIVFETAPRVGSSPGAWVEQVRTPRVFDLTAVRIELKAGTWAAEANPPGTVAFDSVKVVR